jgi:hypothetical protein
MPGSSRDSRQAQYAAQMKFFGKRLILGLGDDGRPVHVVCSPKDDYLAIITTYLPDEREWTDGFKKRRAT